MKIKRLQFPRDTGFALVVVLGILVLLVVLAVGFVGRAAVERTAASGYHSASKARSLADTAVGVVQGQIQTATSQGYQVAWASQPGMIRTFDATGGLQHAYKLYSADRMISDQVILDEDLPDDGAWAASPAVWTDLNAPVAGNYPILDPGSVAEGFAIADAPEASTPGANKAPMPVRWLYVLQDGALVAAPDGSAGNTVMVAGASATNPIVGRVAFWTDDETAKVNINTASEGTYWDTPRFETLPERRELGSFQPAQNEFQRYPGHPAMVSLSSVFPDLTRAEIFDIVPRITGGNASGEKGSDGGTRQANAKMAVDSDRLYASVDELIFSPLFNGERGRNPRLDKTRLEQAKFFLTARSRAPETNLFNLPRVAMWPIQENQSPAARLNTHDRLIAFCSTINGYPYYFQRKDADSAPADIGILRNRQLYGYLQYLTSLNVPGSGGNFLSKYGADRDQILTQIFDYVRSTNLYDETLATGDQFTDGYLTTEPYTGTTGHGSVVPTVKDDTRGFGRFVTLSELAIGFICTAMAEDPSTSFKEGDSNTVDPLRNPALLAAGERRVQAIIVPEFFCAALGYGTYHPDFRVVIIGLQGLTLNGTPLGFPASGSVDYDRNPFDMESSPNLGGTISYRYFGYKKDGTTDPAYPFISSPIVVAGAGPVPFTGGVVTVEIRTRTGNDLLQTLQLKIPDAPALPLPLLTTSGLAQPQASPTSARAWWSFLDNGLTGSDRGGRLRFLFESPGHYGLVANGVFFRRQFDVVRSIVPRHGDYRLIAGQETIADSGGSLFIPHPRWNTSDLLACYLSSSSPLSHGLNVPQGNNPWNPSAAPVPRYFSSLTTRASLTPDIHGDATGSNTPENTGDFDNGMPFTVDGPYINKPDEGFVHRAGSSEVGNIPYYTGLVDQRGAGDAFFSPNRQVPSPVMLGSLPSRMKAGTAWTTLLFRPQPGHFGSQTPRDHLWLDLFWMPVVEPYAISEPFSTAGKLNMNFQIIPFAYVTRSTGLMALLKSEKMAVVPDNQANTYKNWASPQATDLFRKRIDAAETISQFTKKFEAGEIFLSASEICDVPMVPEGSTVDDMANFWNSRRLTGDNMRERIYATLYPRLTTKSNTYTVHFRAQALRKVPQTGADRWEEGKDKVAGEYRGSTTIERFLPNPLPASFQDYAAAGPVGIAALPTLDTFFRWRTIENKQFAP